MMTTITKKIRKQVKPRKELPEPPDPEELWEEYPPPLLLLLLLEWLLLLLLCPPAPPARAASRVKAPVMNQNPAIIRAVGRRRAGSRCMTDKSMSNAPPVGKIKGRRNQIPIDASKKAPFDLSDGREWSI